MQGEVVEGSETSKKSPKSGEGKLKESTGVGGVWKHERGEPLTEAKRLGLCELQIEWCSGG